MQPSQDAKDKATSLIELWKSRGDKWIERQPNGFVYGASEKNPEMRNDYYPIDSKRGHCILSQSIQKSWNSQAKTKSKLIKANPLPPKIEQITMAFGPSSHSNKGF